MTKNTLFMLGTLLALTTHLTQSVINITGGLKPTDSDDSGLGMYYNNKQLHSSDKCFDVLPKQGMLKITTSSNVTILQHDSDYTLEDEKGIISNENKKKLKELTLSFYNKISHSGTSPFKIDYSSSQPNNTSAFYSLITYPNVKFDDCEGVSRKIDLTSLNKEHLEIMGSIIWLLRSKDDNLEN